MRQRTRRALAFTAQQAQDDPGTRTEALREAGWTVLAGGPGRALPSLWQEAQDATREGLTR